MFAYGLSLLLTVDGQIQMAQAEPPRSSLGYLKSNQTGAEGTFLSGTEGL